MDCDSNLAAQLTTVTLGKSKLCLLLLSLCHSPLFNHRPCRHATSPISLDSSALLAALLTHCFTSDNARLRRLAYSDRAEATPVNLTFLLRSQLVRQHSQSKNTDSQRQWPNFDLWYRYNWTNFDETWNTNQAVRYDSGETTCPPPTAISVLSGD